MKKMIPVTAATIASDPYIHNSFGFTVTGINAKFNALPMAAVSKNIDMIMDFIDAGAWV